MNAESNILADIEADAVVPRQKRSLRTILMIAGPAIVLLLAAYFYLSGGRYESTDNASLQTGMVSISPSVSGKVISVEVTENQRVKKGDVLFRIKGESYETTVDRKSTRLNSSH